MAYPKLINGIPMKNVTQAQLNKLRDKQLTVRQTLNLLGQSVLDHFVEAKPRKRHDLPPIVGMFKK